MIVVDASALLEFLLQTPLGIRVEARLFRDRDEFHSPHLADVEVTQGLRRLARTGEVSHDRAAGAIADLTDFDLHRHPHLDLLTRAWKLRENVTAYDAMYIALAEALDAPMVTCDAPLGRAPGHRAHRSDCVLICDNLWSAVRAPYDRCGWAPRRAGVRLPVERPTPSDSCRRPRRSLKADALMLNKTIVIALLVTLGAGCGEGYSSTPASPSPIASPTPAPVGPSSSITIPTGASTLGDRAYSPDEITVAVGSTVTWTNTDTVAHTSTSNGSGWNSGTIAPGQQFSTTLQTAGTFAYHCAIHPGMVGTVTVR